MITLLSPTKTQSHCAINTDFPHTKPSTLEKADDLMSLLKKLTLDELSKLMKISNALAVKTKKEINEWGKDSTPSLFLFQGDAFQKLDAATLSTDELLFSNDHMIILSALYGYLRPFDTVSPYRLDMKDPLKTPTAKNLYHYWKDTITTELNNLLAQQSNNAILNLASDEYFDVIDLNKITGEIIHVEFKVYKDSAYKTVGIYAKRGRGLLARYIIKNKIDQPTEIATFHSENFQFSKKLSSHDNYVFVLK